VITTLSDTQWGEQFLERWYVQGLSILLILSNTVFIGIETDKPGYFNWEILENMFLFLFTCEIAMRMILLGTFFFQVGYNPDFAWNMFDLSIVTVGIVNALLNHCIQDNEIVKNAAVIRMARMLRVFRVLRLIRIIRFLKQLYLLAYGFIEGTMAVFWVTLLASLILYVCAVMLVRIYGQAESKDGYDELDLQVFETKFGSIPKTMCTLFELISTPHWTTTSLSWRATLCC